MAEEQASIKVYKKKLSTEAVDNSVDKHVDDTNMSQKSAPKYRLPIFSAHLLFNKFQTLTPKNNTLTTSVKVYYDLTPLLWINRMQRMQFSEVKRGLFYKFFFGIKPKFDIFCIFSKLICQLAFIRVCFFDILPSMKNLVTLILAAGQGKRMKSDMPKVLVPMAGKAMLSHVLDAAAPLGAERTLVIVGHKAEDVTSHLNANHTGSESVFAEPLGTGYAVRECAPSLKGFEGQALILTGDCPLITTDLLESLITKHNQEDHVISFISTIAEDPTGLGRVIRDSSGHVSRIVEHKDATEEERLVKEINTGLYLVNCPELFELLADVTNNNAQGEYYLPDIMALALKGGMKVGTFTCSNGLGLLGVNSPEQLTSAEELYNKGTMTYPAHKESLQHAG